MTNTIAVPRELAEYAAEVLIESGCLPDEYTPECAQCRMRLMGERLKAVLDQPAAEPGADSQGLRDARYLIGMLIAEAGGRVVIRRDTMVNFDVRQSLESRDDPESGDRIYTLKLPENRGEAPRND